ncbi:CUE domain-containing protein 2 [Nymphon striatum]|nr:CUE domain-containing protein 2 [Nymphon striatum]
MPKSCCAYGCTNHNMMYGDNYVNISFHVFPKNPERRVKWVAAVRRKGWAPTNTTVICGKHFILGKPNADSSHPDYVPSIFTFKTMSKRQMENKLHRYEGAKRRSNTLQNPTPVCSSSVTSCKYMEESASNEVPVQSKADVRATSPIREEQYVCCSYFIEEMGSSGGASDQENLVQKSLTKFLCENLADFDLSLIDDILIDYIVNVIKEDFDCGLSEDESNLESLIEMLDSYIPGVANLARSVVEDWIINLSQDLCSDSPKISSGFYPVVTMKEAMQTNHAHVPVTQDEEVQNSEITENSITDENDHKEIAILTEMFPTSCHLEISHCLNLSNGDVEKAAQLILHREEIDDSINSSSHSNMNRNCHGNELLDDKRVKDSIIAKYSYVDSAEDVKEHRPIVPKTAPKKLIRYRENKIVSLKGERFSDVKKNETDEMKKTYISLKPAKQYRFH